jgi:hypothetical protein
MQTYYTYARSGDTVLEQTLQVHVYDCIDQTISLAGAAVGGQPVELAFQKNNGN